MTRDIDIDSLAERILRGDLGRLDSAELDAVLSWISGSEKLGAGELIHHVGVPRERPDLMRQVYRQLDQRLFADGRLDLRRAGVETGVDDKIRRARFRRLMTAFHPDRHPDRADWLTPRSQAILTAYRAFRSGREASTAHNRASERPAERRPKRSARGQRFPDERSSARLTPEHAGPMTRMRIRLRNIEHLQGKILLVLAIVALVPVAWVYFTYKPYRNGLSAPSRIAASESPQPTPVTQPVADRGAAVAPPTGEPDDNGLAVAAAALPESLDVWGERTAEREESLPVDEFGLDVESLLAFQSEQEPPSDTQTAAAPQPGPARDAPRTSPQPPEAGAARPDSSQSSGEPAPASPPVNAARSEMQEAAPESTPPPPGATEPEPATEDQGQADPAEEAASAAASSPALSAAQQSPPPAGETTPHAGGTSEPGPIEAEPLPIDDRVEHLLADYSRYFATGDLDSLMQLLSEQPRENRNRGRDWFRSSYSDLFGQSAARRIDIAVNEVERSGEAWRVRARFDLEVEYPNRRPVRSTSPVEYTLTENESGTLLIDSIDY